MPNSKKGTYLTPTGQLHTLAAKMSLAWYMESEEETVSCNHCRNGSERPKRTEKSKINVKSKGPQEPAHVGTSRRNAKEEKKVSEELVYVILSC